MDTKERFSYWLEQAADTELASELGILAERNDLDAIEDAFFQELEFGTAGLRGVIGAGTNRMNIYTVGRATQGLANYLCANAEGNEAPRVAIARDNRTMGKEFVEHAACVLAANGVRVFLYPRIEPTPALSFAVRDLHCDAGICMTASHNPAAYNGYKVYDEHGCQITSQAASEISQAIEHVDYFHDVKLVPFDQACATGMISWIDEDTLDRFIEAVHAAGCEDADASEAHIRVAYTPLHGTGLECMKRIFEDTNIDAVLVEDQLSPDGAFPTCTYPNPETKEALELGIQCACDNNCDLVLATDPDADRVGVAVKSNDQFELLTGNEIGILLMDYLCQMRSANHTMPANPIAISTIVSTAMIDAIGREYGVEVKRVLTGFKYIGEIITELEQQGESNRFILGFEESYGYLTGDHVRDKDAINAGLVICQMTKHHRSQGNTLVDAMRKLYEQYGYYANRTINVSFPGASGAKTMQDLMTRLREEPPASFAGNAVQNVIDYATGVANLPKANVVEFGMGEGQKVIFRPSGTEPKVKAYLFAKAGSKEAVQETLNMLEQEARAIMS